MFHRRMHLASSNPACPVPQKVSSGFNLAGHEPSRNLLSLPRAGYFTTVNAGSVFVGFTSPAGWRGQESLKWCCFASFPSRDFPSRHYPGQSVRRPVNNSCGNRATIVRAAGNQTSDFGSRHAALSVSRLRHQKCLQHWICMVFGPLASSKRQSRITGRCHVVNDLVDAARPRSLNRNFHASREDFSLTDEVSSR